MSKNWLIIVALVVVIIGGYWLLRGSYQTQTEAPVSTTTPLPPAPPIRETSQTPKSEFNVTIGNDGKFNPPQVRVKQGDKVTWTNNDTKEHRVSSDPHPIHTALAGFDSITNLGAGETYSFTFDKKGTWDYHDHLNPGTNGTVIVE